MLEYKIFEFCCFAYKNTSYVKVNRVGQRQCGRQSTCRRL